MARKDTESHPPYVVEETLAGRGLSLWLAALAFGLIFYATGLGVLASAGSAFDYLGERAPLFGFAFFATTLLIALLAGLHALISAAQVPRGLLAVAERTGLGVVDVSLTLLVVAAAVVVSLTRGWFFVPLILAVAVPVIWSHAYPVVRRPVVDLPPANVSSAAHFWSEPDLPEVADVDELPPGYSFRRFTWRFGVGIGDERRWAVDVPISEQLVEEMRVLASGRSPLRDLHDVGVRLQRDVTREIHALAKGIRRISLQEGFGVLDEVACVVACLSQATGRAESGVVSVYTPPLLTAVDGGENTRAVPVLCAAVLSVLGHSVTLVQVEDALCLGVDSAEHLSGHFLDGQAGAVMFAGWMPEDGWHVGVVPGEIPDLVGEMAQLTES